MKVPILRLLSALVNICQIPHVIFQTLRQFSSNVASRFSTPLHNSSVLFRSNVIYFAHYEPIKVEILRILSASGQDSQNSCHF